MSPCHPVRALALITVVALLALGCSAEPEDPPPDAASSQSQEDSGTPEASEEPSPEETPTKSPKPGPVVDVSFSMLPQLAQTGPRPAPAAAADSSMSAVFNPAQQGRAVVLEWKDGNRWVSAGESEQDAEGVVEFNAPAGKSPRTYRVVAPEDGNLPEVASQAARTDRWGEADFTDEFSGTSLGAAWSDRLQGYSRESQRACSKADPRAREVSGGVVRLSVLRDPGRTGTCAAEGQQHAWRLNGHIGTDGAESFRYGYAAARVKFQPRKGQHGAFWMQPASRAAEEGDAELTGAEIDVIEWFGNDHPKGGLTSFVYSYPDNGGEGVTGVKTGDFLRNPDRLGSDWADRFHVFSVEWTPERYIFRIDGKESFRTTEGVSGREQFLILSLLSSDYELKNLGGEGKLPQTMEVDWVRYWER